MRVLWFSLLMLLPLLAVADEFDAALIVKTTPTEAEIYINGELRANSSPVVFRLAAGEYELRVTHEFLEEETATVVLTADSTVIREVVLSEIREYRDALADGTLGPTMVLIPAGTFTMGSPINEPDRRITEDQHQVTIDKPFYMSRFEVTFDEYDRFAEATGRSKPSDRGWGRGNRPVINVSWFDATAYADWLSEQTGEAYRLPTEAEWEYAARAGTTTAYWWGNEVGQNRANCDGCGSQWDDEQTAPVGRFAANPWGLHDTAGNVREWVQDCWHENHEGAPADGSAREGQDDCRRVVRGGGWNSYPAWVLSAARIRGIARVATDGAGFRLARP